MAILKMSEYEDFQGKIHIQFDDLVGSGYNWLAPARVLGLNITDFLLSLKKDYDAELTFYKNVDGTIKFVSYKWESLESARSFKNYINRIAREKKITLDKIGVC